MFNVFQIGRKYNVKYTAQFAYFDFLKIADTTKNRINAISTRTHGTR